MVETGYDILILGAGPAGISAALTARARNRSTALLSADPMTTPLAKAHRIENYPGLADSGKDILLAMLRGVKTQDIPLIMGRITGIMPAGGYFMVSAEQEVYTARSLILALGAQQNAAPYPGERELLGRGVSYCATCDGMLYRGRRVAVLGLGAEGEADRAFLESIGCEVLFFAKEHVKFAAIQGNERVTAVCVNGEAYPVDGVFILRETVAADALLGGLSVADGHIETDANGKTSVPGVFAAGDCTGRPYQIARAVGQGNVAALAADQYLKEHKS